MEIFFLTMQVCCSKKKKKKKIAFHTLQVSTDESATVNWKGGVMALVLAAHTFCVLAPAVG